MNKDKDLLREIAKLDQHFAQLADCYAPFTARYYLALVEGGVPADHAAMLTREFLNSVIHAAIPYAQRDKG